LTQEQVDIEVVSRGSRGLFGIGSEPAQVRITPRRAAGTAAGAAPDAGGAAPAAEAPAEPATRERAPAATAPAAPAEAPAKAEVKPEAKAPANVEAKPQAKVEAAGAGERDGGTGDDTAGGTGAGGADEAEMAALAVELLRETVRLMGYEAEVVATWEEPDADNDDRYLLLNLHGRDLGALIGRRGETLGNLQYLLRLMVNQRLHQWKNIVVDVEQYRQHRAEHLMQLALRSADQVATSGRPLALEPMPPNERRIVHLALRDHPSVFTESSGEGERRKIQILPRRSL
jgi:spoIIIJ-associated protein